MRIRLNDIVFAEGETPEGYTGGPVLVETTLGRALFNEALPVHYPFDDEPVDKKRLSTIVNDLAERYLQHKTIKFSDVAGSGAKQVSFDKVPIDKARDYAAEDADITLRLHRALKPRLLAQRLVTVYETIERPLVPVVANVLAAANGQAEPIRQLLVDQVTGRVRWRESMLYLKDQGVTNLVELGAGKVLAGLAKRIDKDLTAVSLHTPAEIDAFLKTL